MTDVEKELEEHVHRILELMGEDANREAYTKHLTVWQEPCRH